METESTVECLKMFNFYCGQLLIQYPHNQYANDMQKNMLNKVWEEPGDEQVQSVPKDDYSFSFNWHFHQSWRKQVTKLPSGEQAQAGGADCFTVSQRTMLYACPPDKENGFQKQPYTLAPTEK